MKKKNPELEKRRNVERERESERERERLRDRESERPSIPSFLRKHPHVANRKIRDTVIETKTKHVSRIFRK